MEFDILSFLIGVAVGIGIVYYIARRVGKMLYERIEAELEQEKEKVEDKRIDLKVEKHGDMLYAFRSDNDGFVCQGLTLKELKQQFLEKFPGHVGAIIGASDELHKELVEQKKELSNESSSSVGSSS